MAQLTINKADMAIRIGELRAVAGSIGAAAGALESGGDLGPGDISGAVAEVAEQWREGLSKMTEKIGTMADNVDNTVSAFDQVEQASATRFARAVADRSADPATFQQRMDSAGGQP